MAAANTDKLRKKKSLFQTTLNGGIAAGDTSLTLQSASGLPTDTGVTIVINRVDANGVATPSAMEVVTGVVSGSTVGSLLRAKDSTTAKSHATASVVEMVWDAVTWNDFVDAYLTEHNQDGTHKFQSLTSKTTPVDADSLPIVDSEASNVLKRLTWANLKAAIFGGGTLTGAIDLGENAGLVIDAALSADGKYSGITEAGVLGETVVFGELCYFKAADSRWWKTDANAAATAGDVKIGICVLAGAAAGATKILLWGKVNAASLFPTLTVSAPVYIGETAGTIVVTQPTTASVIIRKIGFGNTADELFFSPDGIYVTHT